MKIISFYALGGAEIYMSKCMNMTLQYEVRNTIIVIRCKKYQKLTSIIENDISVYMYIETISKLTYIYSRVLIIKTDKIIPIIYDIV